MFTAISKELSAVYKKPVKLPVAEDRINIRGAMQSWSVSSVIREKSSIKGAMLQRPWVGGCEYKLDT